ncbi:MAG: hypothetical protein M3M87_04995 [Thermoproteota archaeon]|nr:hypothetical protein [Thermoproteota archaeon]
MDTNLSSYRKVVGLRRRVAGLPIDFKITTVTECETKYPPDTEVLVETWVLGESVLGRTRFGRSGDTEILEQLVQIISDNSYPKPEKRGSQPLEGGYRNQQRDAIILATHLREQRDTLLTNDMKGFKGKDGKLLKKLKEVAYVEYHHKLRVMTEEEFGRFCDWMSWLKNLRY